MTTEAVAADVCVRPIRTHEEGLAGLQSQLIQKVDGKKADVSGVLRIKAQCELVRRRPVGFGR